MAASQPASGPPAVERIALICATLLAGASLVLGFASGSLEAAVATSPAFAQEFAAAARREQLILFPLGVAATITTIVALLQQGTLRPLRTRLQLLAVAVLFGSGFLATGSIAPAAEAVVVAAASGPIEGLRAYFDHWEAMRDVTFGASFVAVALLFVAWRMPVATIERDPTRTLAPRQRLLLFLLGAATLFEGYDRFIASLALPYIGRDLGAAEGTLGYALSAIRLGAVLSIPLGRLADRRGRRGLLLFTILAYTVATAATGLSQGVTAFVVFQLLAMIFLMTELSLSQVVIAEEFPRDFRAYGQSILGAFGALGAGTAALLFPLFQETALGWRGLYFVGLAPLLLIAWLRRALPETDRFERARAEGRTEEARLADLLAPAFRVRFVALFLLALAVSAAAGPAFAFASYRATHDFGRTPAEVSAMILMGGGLGFSGWFVFGSLAERLGRRVVGLFAYAGVGIAIAFFYRAGWLQTAFAAMVFTEAGTALTMNALGTELFPTEIRSTAKSWVTVAGYIGSMLGLAIVGALAGALGGAAAAILVLAAVPVVSAPLLLLLPESRGRELEELSGPDDRWRA
jgi:MFS transporter, putative metabolite:H+ symporter